MGFGTEIGWCDCTFNGWIGCAKISRGCRFCYAETQERRWHPADDGRRSASVWGRNATRRRTTDANWRKPLTWNRQAQATGLPLRVFSASLADVFEDHPLLPPWRADLFRLIEATPWLRWMLLTKRIDLVEAMTAEAWGTTWPSNVWLGTSVEGQREADTRLPVLLNLEGPAERFVSAEPLLEQVVVAGHLNTARYPLSLLIVGGESGRKARPMHPAWARSLRDQADTADVPFHFKQWGEWGLVPKVDGDGRYLNSQSITLADDGTVYQPGDLSWPDGPRTGEAIRAGHDRADLHALYRVGKTAAGRELDGRTHDGVVRSWAAEVGLEVAGAR